MPANYRLAALVLLSALLFSTLKLGATPILLIPIAIVLALLAWDANKAAQHGAPSSNSQTTLAENPEDAAIPAAISMVEASDLASILLDEDLDVRAHNGGARELFPQMRLGEPLSPAVRNPELLNAANDVLRQGARQSVEILNRIPFDRRLLATLVLVRLETSPRPGFDDSSSPFVLIQIRDLTEQTRLAQMRSDFIANASHELRTPLASLRGFIETLRGPAREDAEAREKFLAIMEEQALRMNRILDDLLSLSRIEMRAHLAPDTVVDLQEVLDSVSRGLQPLAQEAGIEMRNSTAEAPLLVKGDRDELEQVFRNLIQNAIKYGRQGGKVEITYSRLAADASRAPRIAIAIADDGPGIAEEHLPRLTERFYRVDPNASRQRGGTGLGLAIVKHIIARHRGSLDISSELGKGSTFTVTLEAAKV